MRKATEATDDVAVVLGVGQVDRREVAARELYRAFLIGQICARSAYNPLCAIPVCAG